MNMSFDFKFEHMEEFVEHFIKCTSKKIDKEKVIKDIEEFKQDVINKNGNINEYFLSWDSSFPNDYQIIHHGKPNTTDNISLEYYTESRELPF